MKRYMDHTKAQRYMMDSEQLGQLIDVELMREGVIKEELLPQPEEVPELKSKKIKAYSIKSGSYTKVGLFTTKKEAELFLANHTPMTPSTHNSDYDHKYLVPLDRLSLEEFEFYCEEEITKGVYRDQIKDIAAIKEMNVEKLTAIKASQEAKNKIAEPIYEDRQKLNQLVYKLENIYTVYENYVKTAKDDKAVAFSFLEKSYSASDIKLALAWHDNSTLEPTVGEDETEEQKK